MSEEKKQTFEINDGWLITECLCLPSNHDITGTKDDFWLPLCVEINQIYAFKLSCLSDENDKAYLNTTIYVRGSDDFFNININYETFKKEVMKL